MLSLDAASTRIAAKNWMRAFSYFSCILSYSFCCRDRLWTGDSNVHYGVAGTWPDVQEPSLVVVADRFIDPSRSISERTIQATFRVVRRGDPVSHLPGWFRCTVPTGSQNA